MSEKISVEIMRDSRALSDIDVSIAYEGLEKISQAIHIDPFEVTRDDHKFRFRSETDAVNPNGCFNWEKLSTDMTIILTDRDLYEEPYRRHLYGVAFSQAEPRTFGGVCLVRTNIIQPEITVSHEAAHLLKLRYPDRSSKLQAHCPNPECVLHENCQDKTVYNSLPSEGVRHVLEQLSLIPPKYERIEQRKAQEFCPSCVTKLAQHSFAAMQYNSTKSHTIQFA